MRADGKQARLIGFLLGALGSFSGIGCLITGMRLENVSVTAIAFFCAVTALITAVLAGRKLMGVAVGGFLIALLWSWYRGGLDTSVEALLNHISRLYDIGYGWGVIRWSTKPLTAGMAQPALCAVGVLTALGICWSFLRCKGIWLTALLLALPAIPCMVLIDTVPAAAYLFIQFLCLALLLLSRLARKRNQDLALIKLLALPVTAAVLALFICIPQKDYTSFKPVDAFLDYIQEVFTEAYKELPSDSGRQEGSWVDLNAVGPKRQRRDVVMDVTADSSGYLYLKGAAYDTYYGTWWDCTADALPVPLPQTNSHSVTVTTRAVQNVLYLPYGAYGIGSQQYFYPEEDGQVANKGSWRSYTVQYRELPKADEGWQLSSEEAAEVYTKLPQSTKRAATEYLARELPQLQSTPAAWSRAQMIVSHVSDSAQYSLLTGKMPDNHKDFAMWFLEESGTGYCVHFATAATVLLRAAGIPCRYVTGYLVSTRAGSEVAVRQHNAHAWVECFMDGVGWVPLEPTPGSGLSETVGAETTAPTQTVTLPPVTEITQDTQETTLPLQTEETTQNTTGTTLPEPEMQPSEDVSDVGGADGPDSVEKKPLPGKSMVIWLAAALCFAGAVPGQWRLRCLLRQKKRCRGRRNAQTLARWQEVVLHCKVRKEEPDSRLHELAQKARFSHHAITREELEEMDAWLSDSTAKLRQLSLWRRFLATVILALY